MYAPGEDSDTGIALGVVMRLSLRPAVVIAFALVLPACPPASESTDATTIVGASVWSPVSVRMQPNTTIVVRDGIIAWVGPADDARLPRGERILDGDGRYVACVILASDPTADIQATRDIVTVIKAGEVFEPEELLSLRR